MESPHSSVLQTSVHQTPVLQSPSLNLSADSTQKVTYVKNDQNVITQLFAEQLPAIKTGLFNVRMSQGVVISPHWHTNATELVFVISGELQTSVFNPFTQQLMTYRLKPGQASQFPLGWFHWLVALTDHTHLLTIFDVPTPDIVYGGDFLRNLPPEVAARAFCVNPGAYAQAVAPIQKPVILGPPPGCSPAPGQVQGVSANQAVPYPGYPTVAGGAQQSGYPGMAGVAYPAAAGVVRQHAYPTAAGSAQQYGYPGTAGVSQQHTHPTTAGNVLNGNPDAATNAFPPGPVWRT